MDAQFTVMETFIFRNSVRSSGITLTVPENIVKEEIEKGIHPDSKKHMSGLLNHCIPADDATAKLLKGVEGARLDAPAEVEDDKEEEIEKLRNEFDRIGKAYHPAWRAARLRKELLKAQKEQPETPLVEEKQKVEKVK